MTAGRLRFARSASTVLTRGNVSFHVTNASYGQYCTGDYWNAAPTIVTQIDPAYDFQVAGLTASGQAYVNRAMHGAQLNPGNRADVGGNPADNGFGLYTGADGCTAGVENAPYDAVLNIDPGLTGPIVFLGGENGTVYKWISLTVPYNNARPAVDEAQYLTVVNHVPSPTQFPPPSAIADKDDASWFFYTTDIDYSVFQNLAIPAGWPAFASVLADVEGLYQLGITNNLASRNINPLQSMGANSTGNYGQYLGQRMATALISLNLAFSAAEKEQLAIAIGRFAIELAGRLEEGGILYGFGGGNVWTKSALTVAAAMFHTSPNVGKLTAYLDAVVTPDTFGEDTQLLNVIGVLTANNRTTNSTGDPHTTYPAYAVNVPEWTSDPVNWIDPNFDWITDYRGIVGSNVHGNILAVRLTSGALALWNNPLLIEYWSRFWDYEKVPGAPWSCMVSNNYPAHIREALTLYWVQPYTSTPTITDVIADGEYVYAVFDALLTYQIQPGPGDVIVTGVAASVISQGVYGNVIWAQLDTVLTPSDTPSLNFAASITETIGGAATPALGATLATNITDALPTPPIVIEPVNTNGTAILTTYPWFSQIAGIRRLAQFVLTQPNAIVQNHYIVSSTGGATVNRFYFPNTSNFRWGCAGQNVRPTGITPVTDWQMHGLILDFTKTSQSANGLDPNDVAKYTYNGAKATQSGSSVDTSGTITLDLDADVFLNGVALANTPTAGNVNGTYDGSYGIYLIFADTGSGDFPDAEDPAFLTLLDDIVTAAQANDWATVLTLVGGNGENFTGSPALYVFMGTLAEMNTPTVRTMQQFVEGGWLNYGNGNIRQLQRINADVT